MGFISYLARIMNKVVDLMLGIAIGISIGVILLILPLALNSPETNPWEVLDGYSDQSKIRFCEAYDYGPTGIGKLFNEFAREGEPIGTTDELEEYLAEKCG